MNRWTAANPERASQGATPSAAGMMKHDPKVAYENGELEEGDCLCSHSWRAHVGGKECVHAGCGCKEFRS